MNTKHAVSFDDIQAHLASLGQIVTKQATLNKELVARVQSHQRYIEASKFYANDNAH